MKKIFLFLFILGLSSCSNLKYKSDLGSFMNSAQANSPEYLVFINEVTCKDMEGNVGLCAKRVKSNENVTFRFSKRPYSYRLDIECTGSVNGNLSIDVLAEKEFSHVIKADQFSDLISFSCIGEISPKDRSEKVSALFHSRIIVYDKNYRPREKIYLFGESVVFGENAKYSSINDDQFFKKKTIVKAKGYRRSYSESDSMRYNYDGY